MSSFEIQDQTARINGKTYTLDHFKTLFENLGLQTNSSWTISDYISNMRRIQQNVDMENLNVPTRAMLKPSASWNGTFYGAKTQQWIRDF